MKHSKFDEAFKLVQAGISVLLTGEKGSGKTTLAMQVAEALELPFYSLSMTRQTTLSHIIGFINVNGIYVESQLRKAAEHGGVMLLDEIDASDPNVILTLNTIENGYLTFPDKVVDLHPDFRLLATSNPQDNHKDYNGRAKLDAATLDRFDVIDIALDPNLEASMVDLDTISHIRLIRECLEEQNSPTYISMRDTLRYQKRKELELLEGFVERLLVKDPVCLDNYKERMGKLPKFSNVEECETLKDVWEFAETSS
ncbi:denitrification regulatory protein [Alteromonas phage vB_AmeP_PT11-V19]|nr:denitrification regulatory protein [Alteromonas phage vB_AmeP_PT11-V19]